MAYRDDITVIHGPSHKGGNADESETSCTPSPPWKGSSQGVSGDNHLREDSQGASPEGSV